MSEPLQFNPLPARPVWGVRPPPGKELPTASPTRVAPVPERLCIPLTGVAGKSREFLIKPGKLVEKGQPISRPWDHGGAWVHATSSGTVKDIVYRDLPGARASIPCMILDCDGEDRTWSGLDLPRNPFEMSPDQVVEALRQGGIVGLGGAAFPTAVKLQSAPQAPLLLLNGAECEPLISCDEMLLREQAGKVLRGGQMLMHALGAQACVIALESDMPEALEHVHSAVNDLGDERIHISEVTAKYPAGGERQLAELILEMEVPTGQFPQALGLITQNVATAAAVADLFDSGEPMISRLVTLAGSGLAEPCNVYARIGTPVADLIQCAGGYSGEEVQHLVMGGPMMGLAMVDDSLPVTTATNCVAAFTRGDLPPPGPELPCIRCGDCAMVCPARLLPQSLLTAAQRDDMDSLERLGLEDCIFCGCCDYVCPSAIPLTATFTRARWRYQEHHQELDRARHAKRRFEIKSERLERRAAERKSELDAQTPSPESPEGAEAIKAIMERVGDDARDQDDRG